MKKALRAALAASLLMFVGAAPLAAEDVTPPAGGKLVPMGKVQAKCVEKGLSKKECRALKLKMREEQREGVLEKRKELREEFQEKRKDHRRKAREKRG